MSVRNQIFTSGLFVTSETVWQRTAQKLLPVYTSRLSTRLLQLTVLRNFQNQRQQTTINLFRILSLVSLQVPPYLASSHKTNYLTVALPTTPVSHWLQDSHHNLQDTLDWQPCLSRRPVTAQYLIHMICNSSSAAS